MVDMGFEWQYLSTRITSSGLDMCPVRYCFQAASPHKIPQNATLRRFLQLLPVDDIYIVELGLSRQIDLETSKYR